MIGLGDQRRDAEWSLIERRQEVSVQLCVSEARDKRPNNDSVSVKPDAGA